MQTPDNHRHVLWRAPSRSVKSNDIGMLGMGEDITSERLPGEIRNQILRMVSTGAFWKSRMILSRA